MKKIALLLILSLVVVNLYSQTETNKKNMIGAHFAFGVSGYVTTVLPETIYDTKYYYSAGLNYSRALSKRWDLCSGFEYTYVNMTATAWGNQRKTQLELVTIPVHLKYNFGRFFYLNGGMNVNVSTKRSEEVSPLGYSIGIGAGVKHELDSGIILSINPYARWWSVFIEEDCHECLLQGGISLGLGYKF